MSPPVEVFLWVLAFVAAGVGLAGMVLPLLPGTPLLFGGLWLAAWLDDYTKVGVTTLVILGVLAALAFVVDYVAAAVGVKRAGASRQAMVGAGLGALLGLFAGLPGLILGPVIGAMIGESMARRDAAQVTKAGLAAGLGFVIASALKVGLGFTMIGVFIASYFL